MVAVWEIAFDRHGRSRFEGSAAPSTAVFAQFLYRSDFLSGIRTVPAKNHLCKRVCPPHGSSPRLTKQENRINDITVPYVTAAIEAEDPFLNHTVNGIDMYDVLDN